MIRLTKDAEAVDVKAGTVAGGFVTEVTALDKVHLLIQGAGQGMTISMQLEPQEGMKLDIDGDIQATGENFTAAFDVKINGAALGSLTIDGASGGALTGSYTAEGRTEISIADLQNQQSEKAQEFMSNLQVGAMIVMGKIAQALPSFAELLQQMSAPQSAPAD